MCYESEAPVPTPSLQVGYYLASTGSNGAEVVVGAVAANVVGTLAAKAVVPANVVGAVAGKAT